MNQSREALIEEIKNKISDRIFPKDLDVEVIADFIIADRKRIIKSLFVIERYKIPSAALGSSN